MTVDESNQQSLERDLLMHHIYLLELHNALLLVGEYYEDIYINEAEIIDSALEKYPAMKAKREDFFPVAAHLDLCKYIEMILYQDKSDQTYHTFIRAIEKGMTAVISGEFWLQNQKREVDMLNLALTKKSLAAHEHQKFINWGLLFVALLTVLSPFAIAIWFPPSTNINVDKEWIRAEIDTLVQRKVSNQLLLSKKDTAHPKGVVQ